MIFSLHAEETDSETDYLFVTVAAAAAGQYQLFCV